ncbi:hypothetical protein HDU96_004842 [Phlyctochytrium bullatum]|nr:hypothetical protein HDU96_004842 [Phlyctochytrium bullatum]
MLSQSYLGLQTDYFRKDLPRLHPPCAHKTRLPPTLAPLRGLDHSWLEETLYALELAASPQEDRQTRSNSGLPSLSSGLSAQKSFTSATSFPSLTNSSTHPTRHQSLSSVVNDKNDLDLVLDGDLLQSLPLMDQLAPTETAPTQPVEKNDLDPILDGEDVSLALRMMDHLAATEEAPVLTAEPVHHLLPARVAALQTLIRHHFEEATRQSSVDILAAGKSSSASIRIPEAMTVDKGTKSEAKKSWVEEFHAAASAVPVAAPESLPTTYLEAPNAPVPSAENAAPKKKKWFKFKGLKTAFNKMKNLFQKPKHVYPPVPADEYGPAPDPREMWLADTLRACDPKVRFD